MNKLMRIRTLCCVLVAAGLGLAASADYQSYHIGNSLTWDSQPEAIAAMSASQGRTHDVGYHIRCASTLDMIAADEVTCIDPVADFGLWRDALPAHNFDAITIQPHQGGVSTRASDEQVIGEMITTAINGVNTYADTRFFIYQAWPRLNNPPDDYATRWNASVADAGTTPTTYAREYFEDLIQNVRSQNPNATIDMIPVGEVLAEVDSRLKDGTLTIAGYASAQDLYRESDHIHMNAVGRFIAASTAYAVMFGEDPTGIASPAGFFDQADSAGISWDASLLTSQVQTDLQEIVWDVVSDHPFTSVPEPGSLMIGSLGALLVLTRRRR